MQVACLLAYLFTFYLYTLTRAGNMAATPEFFSRLIESMGYGFAPCVIFAVDDSRPHCTKLKCP